MFLRDGKTATITLTRSGDHRHHRAPTASPMPPSTWADGRRQSPTKSPWRWPAALPLRHASRSATRRQHRHRLRPHHRTCCSRRPTSRRSIRSRSSRRWSRRRASDSSRASTARCSTTRAATSISKMRRPSSRRARQPLRRHHLGAVESLGERRREPVLGRVLPRTCKRYLREGRTAGAVGADLRDRHRRRARRSSRRCRPHFADYADLQHRRRATC